MGRSDRSMLVRADSKLLVYKCQAYERCTSRRKHLPITPWLKAMCLFQREHPSLSILIPFCCCPLYRHETVKLPLPVPTTSFSTPRTVPSSDTPFSHCHLTTPSVFPKYIALQQHHQISLWNYRRTYSRVLQKCDLRSPAGRLYSFLT